MQVQSPGYVGLMNLNQTKVSKNLIGKTRNVGKMLISHVGRKDTKVSKKTCETTNSNTSISTGGSRKHFSPLHRLTRIQIQTSEPTPI